MRKIFPAFSKNFPGGLGTKFLSSLICEKKNFSKWISIYDAPAAVPWKWTGFLEARYASMDRNYPMRPVASLLFAHRGSAIPRQAYTISRSGNRRRLLLPPPVFSSTYNIQESLQKGKFLRIVFQNLFQALFPDLLGDVVHPKKIFHIKRKLKRKEPPYD